MINRMPIQGILSSPAAFSQAKFDQLKRQVQEGTVQREHTWMDQAEHSFSYIPKPKTTSEPATPPHAFTTDSMNKIIRQEDASGYPNMKLADAFFPFSYQGHLLNPAFHELDPIFGGQKVDFHL